MNNHKKQMKYAWRLPSLNYSTLINERFLISLTFAFIKSAFQSVLAWTWNNFLKHSLRIFKLDENESGTNEVRMAPPSDHHLQLPTRGNWRSSGLLAFIRRNKMKRKFPENHMDFVASPTLPDGHSHSFNYIVKRDNWEMERKKNSVGNYSSN